MNDLNVKVGEELVILPANGTGETDKNPMFFENGFTREVVVWYTPIRWRRRGQEEALKQKTSSFLYPGTR